MVPESGLETESYRPIVLLPVLSKLFEKQTLKRLKLVMEKYKLMPCNQFSFGDYYMTIREIHRISYTDGKAPEYGKVCFTVFLKSLRRLI